MASPEQITPRETFKWHWNWKVLAFTLVFLPLTLSAGFWQLHRAEEKRVILTAQQALHNNSPVAFASLLKADDVSANDTASNKDQSPVAQRYLRVTVSGDVDPQIFLIDNRMQGGRLGYDVLVPLKVALTEGRSIWLMVNRGWIAGGLDRSQLPAIPAIEKSPQLAGYLYRAIGKPLMLAEDVWQEDVSPLVIQHFDHAKLQDYLGVEVYPYMLRLEDSADSALRARWIIVNVQPQKHTGYAVQWFAMALALVILTLFANSNIGSLFCATRGKKDEQ